MTRVNKELKLRKNITAFYKSCICTWVPPMSLPVFQIPLDFDHFSVSEVKGSKCEKLCN